MVIVNTFAMSHNYHFFFVVGTFQIHFLSNFQVCDTVLLTVITMLYIRSPKLTLLAKQLHQNYTLTKNSISPTSC